MNAAHNFLTGTRKVNLQMVNIRKILLLFVFVGLLAACDAGFQEIDGKYVYVDANESQGRVEHPIPDADPNSFEVLNTKGYARDKLHVYFQYQLLEGADPNTFEAISDLYGKDTSQVYYRGKPIQGADPASFSLINLQWGRDRNDIYIQDRPIKACDPATFELLKDGWEKDSECVYRGSAQLENADPKTFTVLNYWFGKDSSHVYDSFPRIIEGADAATFKLQKGLCKVCAEDKNHCYRYEEVVDCAPK